MIGGRLVQYGLAQPETVSSIGRADSLMASRPDILDRNGEVLATDIRTVSLYAEPHKIVDADEAVERLATVLPDLNAREIYNKLKSNSRFQWLRRQLTPKQQSEILALGIPGIGFRPEKRRFYPGGPTAAHILGHVNIDNRGVAGMERYIDEQGLADLAAIGMTSDAKLEPVRLSIDVRVQNIVRDVIDAGMKNYQAIAAGAVVLDVHTGEVLAMASVPDYDPNRPAEGAEEGWMNRMSNGTFEMGPPSRPSHRHGPRLRQGDAQRQFRCDGADPHRRLYDQGLPRQAPRADSAGNLPVFLEYRHRQDRRPDRHSGPQGVPHPDRPADEASDRTAGSKAPSQPREWKKINSITISFGHGVSTTPLQTAVAGAALVNGGKLIPPTFLPRSEEAASELASAVVKKSTSEDMRYLLRWNGIAGSGKRALVPGFNVGGKTGTADKVVNGRYASDLNFNAFLAAFPIDDPKYMVLTFIDAPKTGEGGGRTAGSNAAPMVRDIISRSAPLLGVEPKFGEDGSALLVSY